MKSSDFVLLLVFFLCTGTLSFVHGQSYEIEKIRQQIEGHPQQDTFRVNRLNAICNVYPRIQVEELERFSDEALLISQNLGYAVGKGYALIAKARVAIVSGKRETAIQLLKDAENIAKQNHEPVLQFWVLFRLALCFAEKDNRQALTLALKAEELAQTINNKKLLSIAQLRAAETYTNLSDYARAMEYSLKSQKSGEEAYCLDCQVASWGRMAHIYTLVGNYDKSNWYYHKQMEVYTKHGFGNTYVAALHNNLGENFHRLAGKYPEALQHYREALKLDTSLGRKAVTEINVADVYVRIDSLQPAFKYAFSSLRLAMESDDLVLEAWIDGILARAYLKKQMADSALYYARIGLAKAKHVSNIEHMSENTLAQANAYSAKGDFKNAFEYHKLYIHYRDSMVNTEIKNKVAVLEHTHELEKKQNEIVLLSQQKRLQQNVWIAVFVILFFVIATAMAMLKNNRQQVKYFHQRQLLKSTIQTQEEERKRISRDLHDELGAVLSIARMHLVQLRDHKSGEITNGLQEACKLTETALATMRRISHELMPPLLENFGLIKTLKSIVTQINEAKHIALSFTVSDETLRWPVSIELGLYRISMELINNTLKHARATSITIGLHQEKDFICLMYADNGIGLATNHPKGRGFSNIETRANIMGGNFTQEKGDTKGFRATVTIPNGGAESEKVSG